MTDTELSIFREFMDILKIEYADERQLKYFYALVFDFDHCDQYMRPDESITTSELMMQSLELLVKLTMEQNITSAAALKVYWDDKAKKALDSLELNLTPAQREYMENMPGIKLMQEIVRAYHP